jgi:hypothetical protein
MDNKTLQYILKMKDEATAVWNKFHTTVEQGSKKMFDTIKNHYMNLRFAAQDALGGIQKIWNMAWKSAEFEQSFASLKMKIKGAGLDIEKTIADIKKASGGIMDEDDFTRIYNRAATMGIPIKNFADLMLVARQSGRGMGIGVTEALELITEGIGRGNVRMLKRAGIMLDMKKITEQVKDATAALGGETDSLAVKTAILEQVQEKYIKNIDMQALNTLTKFEKMQQIKAKLNEMQMWFNSLALKILASVQITLLSIENLSIMAYKKILGAAAWLPDALGGGIARGMIKAGDEMQGALYKQINDAKAILSSTPEQLAGVLAQPMETETKAAAGSLEYLQTKAKYFEGEMNKMKFGTAEWKAYKKELDETAIAIEKIERKMTETKAAAGSLEYLQNKAKYFEAEMNKLKFGTAAWQGFKTQLDETTVAMERIERAKKGLGADTGFMIKPSITAAGFDSAQVGKFMQEINDKFSRFGNSAGAPLALKIGISLEDSDRIEDQLKILSEIKNKAANDDVADQQQILEDWYTRAIEMAHGNADIINRIEKIAGAERIKLRDAEFAKWKAGYNVAAGFVKQGLNIISQFNSQNSNATIDKIETEKEERLNAMEAEIENQRAVKTNNAIEEDAKQKKLAEMIKEKERVEKEYNEKVKAEKLKAWQADKEAKSIMAIIDTASAVVEALPNIPLAIIAGVMGLAQQAVISAQSPPKFHTGGKAYYDAPPTSETDVRIRGGETLRVSTPEQEIGMRGGVSLHFHDCYFADEESFKKIIERGMRKAGITDVSNYFKNNRSKITL